MRKSAFGEYRVIESTTDLNVIFFYSSFLVMFQEIGKWLLAAFGIVVIVVLIAVPTAILLKGRRFYMDYYYI